MLHCLRSSQATTVENGHRLPPPYQGSSADITPRSDSQASPTINLTNEYALAVQTNSYSEIRVFLDLETEQPEEITQEQRLAQVLRPNRECVEEVLQRAKPSSLINLLWSCFDHNENAARMCLDLSQAIRRVRTLVTPLHDLLLVLPLDSETGSLTSPQRNRTFDLLLEYEHLENPFPDPGSLTVRGMRHCFSDLNNQLENRINKSSSRIRLLRRATVGSVICLIGTAVGVVASGAAIAGHALLAMAVTPCIPTKMEKKELSHLAQLDAAQRGTYVLHEHIVTIDRLVVRIHSEIEGNKRFIHSGLWRGKDKHSIPEVARQLRRNNTYFQKQLTDLEEHLCLSFAAINHARSRLLQAINLHQNDNS